MAEKKTRKKVTGKKKVDKSKVKKADKPKTKVEKTDKPKAEVKDEVASKLAVIRVRGRVHVREEIQSTLKLLNLNRVNHCVVVNDTPQYRGMINKAKDYITWGETNKETLTKLLDKRGRIAGNRRLDKDYLKKNTSYKSTDKFIDDFIKSKTDLKAINIKPVFRLRPPKKGYERAGIKKPFSVGGALGYRGKKINDLLERMI